MKQSPYPEWVVKHRKPGTEIKRIKDNYYLYEVKAYYDPVSKRGKKKSTAYLGRIMEDEGLVGPTQKKVPKAFVSVNPRSVSTKDYGLWGYLESNCGEIIKNIKRFFPNQWEWIIVALYCRLVHTSPLKNMCLYYEKSFLSEEFNITANSATMSSLIKDLGNNRQPILDYFRHSTGNYPLVLMDATSIVSHSNNLNHVKDGMTKYGSFEPIFNLLYFYCPDNYLPVYYRLFDGNLKDVTMVGMALQESNYKNALFIADKGFYSAENIKLLEEWNLEYIIPLKRNSGLIKKNRYKKMKESVNKFMFDDRSIIYDSYAIPDKKKVYLFIDESLMTKESRDYTQRMLKHPEDYPEDKFKEESLNFGTFAVITNKPDEAEQVYINYKSRCGVEILFDGVKNILGNDHTYMHEDNALEGWMFVNHLALQVHHKIYALLKEHQLLSKYSIRDFIEYLVAIRKVQVDGKWLTEPMTKKQAKFLKDLGISIP